MQFHLVFPLAHNLFRPSFVTLELTMYGATRPSCCYSNINHELGRMLQMRLHPVSSFSACPCFLSAWNNLWCFIFPHQCGLNPHIPPDGSLEIYSYYCAEMHLFVSRLGQNLIPSFNFQNTEFQFFAITVIRILVKLDENWLLRQAQVVTNLLMVWVSNEFHDRHRKIVRYFFYSCPW